MASPEPEEIGIVKFIYDLIQHSKWTELALVFLVVYAPGFLKWLVGLFRKDKTTKLYEQRLADKDKEIKRLDGLVKELLDKIDKDKR